MLQVIAFYCLILFNFMLKILILLIDCHVFVVMLVVRI